MAVALHGNLRDFGIGEVFQLIGQQRKTGILEVNEEGTRIAISFDEGAVVSGERVGAYPESGLGEMLVRTGSLTPERLLKVEEQIERDGISLRQCLLAAGDLGADELEDILDLVTRDTIFELLRWKGGSFHFEAYSLEHSRDPIRLMPAEQILMDGLRMVDEWSTLDADAVDGTGVFERTGHFDAYRSASPDAGPDAMARAERLFLLIDGRQTTRRIVDLSRLGTFEGTRILSNLRRAGLISPVAADTVANARQRFRSLSDLNMPSPLSGLLGALPIVLLAVLAAGVWLNPAAAPVPPRSALPPASAASETFELRRLRNAVEAYRFAQGRWPASLAELDAFSDPADRSMAPSGGHEYYYAHRGETFLVLAPED